MRLFKEVRKQLGDVKIIAEDLGFLTKHVVKCSTQADIRA